MTDFACSRPTPTIGIRSIQFKHHILLQIWWCHEIQNYSLSEMLIQLWDPSDLMLWSLDYCLSRTVIKACNSSSDLVLWSQDYRFWRNWHVWLNHGINARKEVPGGRGWDQAPCLQLLLLPSSVSNLIFSAKRWQEIYRERKRKQNTKEKKSYYDSRSDSGGKLLHPAFSPTFMLVLTIQW